MITSSTPSISHQPVWLDTPLPRAFPMTADAACDVCVVGGGIAGLLITERLHRLGMSVTVLEKGQLAAGETGHTTAHFTSALDDRYMNLRRLHGRHGAALAAQSHQAAIDHAEWLIRELGIDCGWRRLDGYLTVNDRHTRDRDRLLNEELDAAREAGLQASRAASLPKGWPTSLGPALRFPGQAQVHPLAFLRGIIERLLDKGVKIHERTHATAIRGGQHAEVRTGHGPVVRCRHIVVATNTPINNTVAMHTKQAGYQTYVSAFRVDGGLFEPALFWDGLWGDDTSYHYVRLLKGDGDGDDLLIVGGEDHKTGQGPDGDAPYRCLDDWTRRHFPQAGEEVRRWSGEVMEPADGLGYIGRSATGPGNVYTVTGDSGNGMTHGTIAALLIPDLISGRDHPWASLYEPSRKIGFHALSDYTRENVNTLAQYGDWFKRGEVQDESEIQPGHGAIMTSGLKHIAVYKDEHGMCHRMNAMCTHLGGVVRWNEQEQTWDCPCHASRFDKFGKVLHGPANRDLGEIVENATNAQVSEAQT